jgi:hypothetical protein
MNLKRTLLMVASLGLLFGLAGCGEDSDYFYIRGWDWGGDTLDLTVGQEHKINVRLNQAVRDLTYVDITEENQEVAKVINPDSLVLKYKAGDAVKEATIRGVSDSGSQYWKISFKIRNSNERRDLRVRVTSTGIPPQSDTGATPKPDTVPWPQPDTGPPPPDGPVAQQ